MQECLSVCNECMGTSLFDCRKCAAGTFNFSGGYFNSCPSGPIMNVAALRCDCDSAPMTPLQILVNVPRAPSIIQYLLEVDAYHHLAVQVVLMQIPPNSNA